MRDVTVVVAAVLVLSAPGAAGGQERAEAGEAGAPLYLIGAEVHDGIGAEPMRDATVVVSGGRIERVERGRLEPPTAARVLRLDGLRLVPGLIDAHTHVSTLAGARRALESGVTTMRTAGVRSYRDFALRALVEDGILPGPNVLAAGIYVQPDLGERVLADRRLARLHDGVESPEEIRHLVRVNLDHGADWIKTRATERAGLAEQQPRRQVYTETQLRTIVEEAGREGVPVMVHAHGDAGIRAAVRAGARSIEHGTFASDETLRLMAEGGTYLVPTLSPALSFGAPGEYSDPDLYLRGRHMGPRSCEMTGRAYEMGIPIVTGADTYYGEDSVYRISREVEFLVECGVEPLDAFRGATSVAAELLGVPDRTGSIRPGLEADLLVVERSPLEDIRTLQDVFVVMSNGRVVVNRLPFAKDGAR